MLPPLLLPSPPREERKCLQTYDACCAISPRGCSTLQLQAFDLSPPAEVIFGGSKDSKTPRRRISVHAGELERPRASEKRSANDSGSIEPIEPAAAGCMCLAAYMLPTALIPQIPISTRRSRQHSIVTRRRQQSDQALIRSAADQAVAGSMGASQFQHDLRRSNSGSAFATTVVKLPLGAMLLALLSVSEAAAQNPPYSADGTPPSAVGATSAAGLPPPLSAASPHSPESAATANATAQNVQPQLVSSAHADFVHPFCQR